MTIEEYIKANIKNEALQYHLLHQRGYAQRFDWVGPDREQAKKIKETGILDEWIAARFREQHPFTEGDSSSPPKPDCELIDNKGRKFGIEITEFVDRPTIERNQKISYHWKEYTPGELCSAVEKRLVIKDRKLRTNLGQSSRQDYDEVIVILHTDEPALNPDFCRAALANHEFPAFEVITAADMLFPCPRKGHINDRDSEYCRIVPVIPCATFARYQSVKPESV
ncbi:MAG: hypothetical protein WCE51_03350 [Chthoniobacterales bacterium]|jgi:hypothetical protein